MGKTTGARYQDSMIRLAVVLRPEQAKILAHEIILAFDEYQRDPNKKFTNKLKRKDLGANKDG